MIFRYVLYFIILYLIIRFFQNLFHPRTNKGHQFSNQNYQSRKEGEVRVDLNQQPKEKRVSKNEGDYIDYEEV